MQALSYRGYRFPPAIIQNAVWLYLRFTFSFRDVEDLLAERGGLTRRAPLRFAAFAEQRSAPKIGQ